MTQITSPRNKVAALIGILAVCLVVLVIYRGGSEIVRGLTSRSSSTVREPDAQALRSTQDAQRSAGETSSRADAAPLDAGVTGFRGELWLAVGKELRKPPGQSFLTLVPRAELRDHQVGEADAVTWSAGVGELSLEDFDAEAKPTVHAAREVTVLDGEWTMPIPAEALVVWEASSPAGEPLLIDAGEIIAAGAESARVTASPAPTRGLNVVDAETGRSLDGLEVRVAARLADKHQIRDIVVTKPTRIAPRADGPDDERRGPEPPDWVPVYATSAQAPVELPLLDREQSVWIGREGYAWECTDWPRPSGDCTVRLRRVGSLEIQVTGWSETRRSISLKVLNTSGWSSGSSVPRPSLTAGWPKIRGDRTLQVIDYPAGEYELRAADPRRGGAQGEYRMPIRIIGGEVTTIALDLAQVLGGPFGGLDIDVLGGGPGVDDASLLVIAPCHGAQMGAPFFSHQLKNLEYREGGRGVTLPALNTGRYLVGHSPTGLQEVVEVQEGRVAHVSLDLARSATLRVWPVGLDPVDARRHDLVWKRGDATGFLDLTDGDAVDGPIRDALLRPVDWHEDHWSLRSPAGELWLLLRDQDGSIACAQRASVTPGQNDLSIDCESGRVLDVPVACEGAESVTLARLGRLLPSVVRASAEGGQCIEAVASSDPPQLKLFFTDPGTYFVDWGLVPDELRPREHPTRLVAPSKDEAPMLRW